MKTCQRLHLQGAAEPATLAHVLLFNAGHVGMASPAQSTTAGL